MANIHLQKVYIHTHIYDKVLKQELADSMNLKGNELDWYQAIEDEMNRKQSFRDVLYCNEGSEVCRHSENATHVKK